MMDGNPNQARWAAFSDLEVDALASAMAVANSVTAPYKPEDPPPTDFGESVIELEAELARELERRGFDPPA